MIALAAGAPLFAAQPVIRFEPPVFKVTGWGPMRVPEPGDWPQAFAIYAGEGDVPQVLGSYRVVGGDLIFQLRYPLRPGGDHVAVEAELAGSAQRDARLAEQRVIAGAADAQRIVSAEHVCRKPGTCLLDSRRVPVRGQGAAPNGG